MIILEGSDVCGKTSFARELLDRLPGWSYRHHTNPAKIAPCYNYLMWFLADTHAKVIVDRLHWSDWAYGHTYRGGPELTPPQRCIVELCCLALNTVVCYLHDTPEAIRSRWSDREMFDAAGVDGLLTRYRELVNQTYCLGQPTTRLPSYSLNYGVGETGRRQVIDWLFNNQNEAILNAPLQVPCSQAIGSPKAKFLVIGEALPRSFPPSGDHGSAPDVPFARGYAAEWWWRAADAVGLQWWEGAYTNAAAFGRPHERHHNLCDWLALRYLEVDRILCLGESAWSVIEELRRTNPQAISRFASYKVPHPRHVRQFHHRDFPYWASLIGEHLRPYCTDPSPVFDEAWTTDEYDRLMEDDDA